MKIGIDASRAFFKKRTGIEEYSYQVIRHLRGKLKNHQVFLYLKKGQVVDFKLPSNWQIKVIGLKYFWTQLALSLEMLFHSVDVLFVPAHIIPWIVARKTIVVIHGLEYEFCQGAYSFWEKLYMRFFIKRSVKRTSKVIAVSKNTKQDLINLYKVNSQKIQVVYEGIAENFYAPVDNSQSVSEDPYLLFLGRIEERKNVTGIIRAFEIIKEKYHLPHKLFLVGKPGYGYQAIEKKIKNSKFKDEIFEAGYVSDKEKESFLEQADVFLFPTFYEGFGLPILEAQSLGVPVITSDNSSMPEVAGDGGVLVDPNNHKAIAEAVNRLFLDKNFRNDIIRKGYENTKRFSWEKCAEEISKIIED